MFKVEENSAINATVGTLVAVDEDRDQTHTFRIIPDSSFAIRGDLLVVRCFGNINNKLFKSIFLIKLET